MSQKIWIKNALYFSGEELKQQKGDICIHDDRIVSFSAPKSFLKKEYQLLDGQNKLVTPGFINCHTHVAMSLFRGYAGGLALGPWLTDYIWPAEALLTDEDVTWGSALGIMEMLAAGVTCFADMYDHMNAVAETVAMSGIRANLSRGMIGMNDPGYHGLFENDQLYEQWNGAENDRIRVYYGPHAPYTCPPDYLQKVVERAHEQETGIHIHLAETKEEVNYCYERYGKSPTRLCADLGLFDGPCLAAHAVWLSETDRKILADKNVAIAHNPISNMKLASGTHPLIDMQNRGVILGFGTDGSSSNNNLSVLKDMQIAALVQKLDRMDPQVLTAKEAFKMATIQGAKALNWEKDIGSLEIGKKADLVLWDLDKPHLAPWHDHLENFVYAAQSSDVVMTMVDGKILYQAGEFLSLDREKILSEAKKATHRLIQ